MVGRMRRVEIVGPVNLLHATLHEVQEEGVLHIEEVPLSEYGEKQFLHRVSLPPDAVYEQDTIEELQESLKEAIAAIPKQIQTEASLSAEYRRRYAEWENAHIGELSVAARSLHAKVRSIVRRQKNVEDDLEALASYETVVTTFIPLVEGHELPHDYDFVGITLEPRSRFTNALVKQELRKLTNGEFLYFEAAPGRKSPSALVGFSHRHVHDVRHFILDSGIDQMNVPRHLRDKPFEEGLALLQEDLEALRKKQKSVKQQAQKFFDERTSEVLALAAACSDRNTRHAAMSAAATTRYAFILRGWLPTERRQSLISRLGSLSEDHSIIVRDLPVGPSDVPPVVLKNPRPVRPFEPLLSLFPLPRYRTIDPTFFFATFFPPMFGLMLGDIGYGLIVGLGGFVLYMMSRGRKLMRSISYMVLACAFFSVLFGALFGELFGELGHRLFGLMPLWQQRFSFTGEDRTKTLFAYLAIAIIIGFVHVMLGLVLGIINSRRMRDRNMMRDSVSKIVGIFLLLLFVGRLTRFLPPIFTSFAIVAAVIFVVLMIFQVARSPAHGMMLPMEVLSTLGNILSYVRIMAIGLVSVILAYLANNFGGMMGNIALGVVIGILVHVLNLALGIVDPTIQGLRLQYVEFLPKFFIGGGKPYNPLRKAGGVVS